MDDDYMKRQLPKWLRAVEIQSAGPRLAAIESSANNLAQTLSGRGVLDMTLLAHGRSHGDAFDQLSESLQEDDPTFGCLADDLETRIAASATVCALLAERSTSASIAAQGVLSAQWLRLSPAVAELPALAVDTSRRRSELFRNEPPCRKCQQRRTFSREYHSSTRGKKRQPIRRLNRCERPLRRWPMNYKSGSIHMLVCWLLGWTRPTKKWKYYGGLFLATANLRRERGQNLRTRRRLCCAESNSETS